APIIQQCRESADRQHQRQHLEGEDKAGAGRRLDERQRAAAETAEDKRRSPSAQARTSRKNMPSRPLITWCTASGLPGLRVLSQKIGAKGRGCGELCAGCASG